MASVGRPIGMRLGKHDVRRLEPSEWRAKALMIRRTDLTPSCAQRICVGSMPMLVLPFPAINPVLVQWGPLAIRWYALA